MAEEVSDTARAIVAAYWDRDPQSLTAADLQKFEAEFPGTLEKIANTEAKESELYDVPEVLRTLPNRGGGDCLYLALMQLLEPKEVAQHYDIRSELKEFRRVTAEGLETVIADNGVSWSDFKTLMNDNDKKIIQDIEQNMLETFGADELRKLTQQQRDALEIEWFQMAMRKDYTVWGDNMYLLMFLRSPLNPYTEDVAVNVLLIDRLAHVDVERKTMAAPLCFTSGYRKPGMKCVWGVVVRTRTDEGRGANHYEAGVLPDVPDTLTRFKGLYSTSVLRQALQASGYLPYVIKNTECSDLFRQCTADESQRKRGRSK